LEAWEETKRRDHTRRNLAVYPPLGAHRLGAYSDACGVRCAAPV
jgi:hypothetical protein